MWHALECARQAAHVVPAVPGGAAGTVAGAARVRSAVGPARRHRRARRGRTRSCHAVTGGSPCAPVPGRRSGAVAACCPRRRATRVIPGWGLNDYIGSAPQAQPTIPAGPSTGLVGSALRATAIVLAVAAAVHAVRYVLLVINRNTLLHPVVAGAALWLGVVASVSALAAVIGCAIVLTRWLIARRAAVYAHYRREDPRSARCAVGGLPGTAGQPRVGTGPCHRDRDHRGGLQPTAQADHRVVGAVGAQHRCCRSSRSRPVSPPTRRASPTTP